MADEYKTYWLTRDCDQDGNVSQVVDVWIVQPHRRNLPGDVGCIWLDDSVTGLEGRYTQWSLAAAAATTPSRVIPDNDRECIRVG